MMWRVSVLYIWALTLFSVACSAYSTYTPKTSSYSDQCQCYLVSGPDPGYFQEYRFWDFRDTTSINNISFPAAPAFDETTHLSRGWKSGTSHYLHSLAWRDEWSIQDGPQNTNASVPTYNSARNVYISRNTSEDGGQSTFLTLRAHRLESFMSIAEIQSSDKYILYSSIRGRFRVIPNDLSNSSALFVGTRKLINNSTGSNASHPVDSGAVFGFFTYSSDNQEVDTEILSRDNTSRIHYSTQPVYDYSTNLAVTGASEEMTLPDSASYTDWLDYRMDWFDGAARWYIGDRLARESTVNVPNSPSTLILNLWGDGGDWSGNMSVGGQVTVGIEWIEMVYNISDPWGGRNFTGINRRRYCNVGCHAR